MGTGGGGEEGGLDDAAEVLEVRAGGVGGEDAAKVGEEGVGGAGGEVGDVDVDCGG